MHSKSTTNYSNLQQIVHQLPAGLLQEDNRTELFGCRESKKVYVLSQGKTISFKELNPVKKALIFERLLNDDAAMNDLQHLSQQEALEQFAFCIYGAADHDADFSENGFLNESDNFLCSNSCKCINWKSKVITIDKIPLTIRQLEIIQLMASDLCDKQIADKLGISESTLDSHKTKMFEKFGVHSKSGMITKAVQHKIIQ